MDLWERAPSVGLFSKFLLNYELVVFSEEMKPLFPHRGIIVCPSTLTLLIYKPVYRIGRGNGSFKLPLVVNVSGNGHLSCMWALQ